FVCYPQRQIEYTTTAIAIPAVVNASGQVIAKHPSHLPARSVSDTPSPVKPHSPIFMFTCSGINMPLLLNV
ncbi:TPA: hypothetical protein ACJINS_005363, partial [Escherichia coli]